MATVKKLYVFLACVFSGLAALFGIIALSTEQWVYTNTAAWTNPELTRLNTIEYGLFQGFSRLQGPTIISLQISMTCLMSDNVCALLCGRDMEERQNLLRQLYTNDPKAEQNISNCPSVQRAFSSPLDTPTMFKTELYSTDTNVKFINAGLWVSTIFFLVVSIVLGVVACTIGLWNTVSNPVQSYLSILGLYIYNAAALGFTVLVMCLWGIMHIVIIFHNVGIFNTLNGSMVSDKTAQLGYSYWLLFLPISFYSSSIALLYARQYLLSKDPGHKMVQRDDSADPGLYLY